MSKKKPTDPAAPPSAGLMQELDALTAKAPSEERNREAWTILVRGQANPDFHAVLDFATDAGLCLPCVNTDPKHTPNLTWVNPIDGTEMVWIPPGEFLYGSPKKPAAMAGFSLAKFPITNSQFAGFLKETGFEPEDAVPEVPEDEDTGYTNGAFLHHWESGKLPNGKNHHPVVYVSYIEALAYCEWAGLTLPSEYQWEKAARGTDGRIYPWGDNIPYSYGQESKKKRTLNIGQPETGPVTELEAIRSPFGCVQMLGNISQWCQPGNEQKVGEFPPLTPKINERDQACVRGVPFFRPVYTKTKAASHRRKLAVHRRNSWTGFRPACFLPVRPAVV